MSPRPWTLDEIKVLRAFAALGVVAVAELLERSPSSVTAKATELQVSMRTTDDDIDLGLLPARILVWVRESPRLHVCPACGRRLARVRSTGLCRVCHLEGLLEIRREQLDVIVREKQLAQLRQQKKRVRVCRSCGEAFYPKTSSTATTCKSCGGGHE